MLWIDLDLRRRSKFVFRNKIKNQKISEVFLLAPSSRTLQNLALVQVKSRSIPDFDRDSVARLQPIVDNIIDRY